MSTVSSYGSQWLLGTYYYATLPWRAWWNRAEARAGRAPIIVLFYHRIADHTWNAWTMPTRTFERQVKWLSEHFEMISLAQAQARLAAGHNARPAVAITFDDGYAENCDFALPLLIEHAIPVSYFVASRHVIERQPFPHDAAVGKPLPTNSIDELRDLAAAGIEIGAHTRNHADLGKVRDPAELQEEIVICRTELEQAVGRPIRYFSFPFGLHRNLTSEAFAAAREAGFAAVCSAYGGYNLPGDDPFHLQRIHADREMIRLKNWLSVDPRKQALVRRFVPDVENAHVLAGADDL